MKNIIKKGIATIATVAVVCGSGIAQFGQSVLAYNAGIEAFVNSLYSDCLGRSADPTGFNDWCNKLATGQISGKQAAYGFFFSPEFQAKANAWSDTELINAYYKVFLNRGSDPSGASYWAQQIAGTTNDISILFTGFADSVEFANKCASYGITVGPHVDVPTTVRGTSSGSTDGSSGTGLAAQTNGARANSVEELDAYWTSQGYEVFYIDLGNGNTQKCYAQFYDMTEHYNLVNAWRNEQGIASLTPITDPNDVRYQWARTRAVEISYFFSHRTPRMMVDLSICSDDRDPSGGAGENITAVCDPVVSFENFRNSGLHAAGMRRDFAHYITVAGCHVVFVNADGISTTTVSPYGGPYNGYGDGTAQLLWT